LANEFINKNVAFVYICINSEFDKWQKAVVDMKLNQNQYFLNEVESKVVKEKFQIQGLPTYFMINKKGEIIDKEAPRPSDILTKAKINELLNEK
jgi:thioredoxin-related protein